MLWLWNCYENMSKGTKFQDYCPVRLSVTSHYSLKKSESTVDDECSRRAKPSIACAKRVHMFKIPINRTAASNEEDISISKWRDNRPVPRESVSMFNLSSLVEYKREYTLNSNGRATNQDMNHYDRPDICFHVFTIWIYLLEITVNR